MKRIYEELRQFSKEETLLILNGDNPLEDKVGAILGAVNSIQDQPWLERLCLNYINNEEEWIAAAAINGLGDIARIFRKLDVDRVLRELNSVKQKRENLAGKIDDAIDDIKIFIKCGHSRSAI